MYISTNWLKILLNLKKIKLNYLKERLTLSGFEVEETKVLKILKKHDVILNVGNITNRPDILSMAGLAEEIKNLFSIEFKQSTIKKKSLKFFNIFSKEKEKINVKTNFFSTIAFISSTIENIEIKKIQPWIQKRLLSNNIIPSNNLNDLAQYCLLEWGQPIYIYDLEKLRKLTKTENPEIYVRFAKANEIFIDNNFKKYLLNEKTLLVVANNIPISIAGSIISKDCFVDNNTKNILIELSIFDAKVFRKSERSIGIRTEASIFYEKGVNKFLIKDSYNRFLNLINLFNNNDLDLKIKFCFSYSKQLNLLTSTINLSFESIKKILGNNNSTTNKIDDIKILNYLKRLNFKFSYEKNIYSIYIPLTRIVDIEEEIDIIEEICRFYGFNKFESILPSSKKLGKVSRYETMKRKFREFFINVGFTEIYNYSLISENLDIPILLNPLAKDYSSLRDNLFLQLFKILEKNITQGNKSFPIFEISRIFNKNYSSNSFLEDELICAIFGGSNYRISWSNEEIELNWFQAKYFLEMIFKNLQLNINFSKKLLPTQFYHSKNCLSILLENQEIGTFGKINPKLCFTKSFLKNCFLIEIEFTKLFKIKNNNKKLYYIGYSSYPSLSADLSLLIPINITFDEIIRIIKKYAKDLIQTIELFDVYEKFEVNYAFYSLGLKIIFKSNQKTLLKTEIDEILVEIENKLKENLNITIRI